jgi:hypothetical protein
MKFVSFEKKLNNKKHQLVGVFYFFSISLGLIEMILIGIKSHLQDISKREST